MSDREPRPTYRCVIHHAVMELRTWTVLVHGSRIAINAWVCPDCPPRRIEPPPRAKGRKNAKNRSRKLRSRFP